MFIMHDLSYANSTIMDTCQQLTRLQIGFADRMHEDRSVRGSGGVRIAVGFNTMGLWTLTKGMVIHILGIAIGIRYT